MQNDKIFARSLVTQVGPVKSLYHTIKMERIIFHLSRRLREKPRPISVLIPYFASKLNAFTTALVLYLNTITNAFHIDMTISYDWRDVFAETQTHTKNGKNVIYHISYFYHHFYWHKIILMPIMALLSDFI